MHKNWPRRRAHQITHENINDSNFDGMSLASFAKVGQSSLNLKYLKLTKIDIYNPFCNETLHNFQVFCKKITNGKSE